MATQAQPVSSRDALDIIFAQRNRAYGAYALRREYPVNLGKALSIGFLLIGFFIVLPHILQAFAGLVPREIILDNREIILSPPRDIDPATPPPPPPPPITPPPPVHATIAFVPPVVLQDNDVPDEDPPAQDDLVASNVDISNKDVAGDGDAPPIDIDPTEFKNVIVSHAKPEEEPLESYAVNKLPSFPGGDRDLMAYLAKNIDYPTLAKEANIEGVVVLGFVVGKDGSIKDINIMKDIGGGCGKEALRVVREMPRWSPGEANGHAVKVRFTLPVRFKLQ
ncbi:MAG: TonB family protein [Lewinellaceae bacterium]|nr:TonB family protein [Lewinellaceae bacterium]